ncbi:hypothetical protein SPRG_00730 [Saprolegnia parasitica CBS 223.65]|uniref:Uncharacterized protein n=1 Tax=Saprolegnia parasitica (strain CBS 223.65) TaxID=695850 RepID=A0A067D6R3_SAPPC|nr:hypothetical protein SPRG_00730 [Saprolegnia parasitica CBS 223.65]KDO34667.1 hypothetical protein SPRG_00730 [Saprolegnia parasitica CBS 223.65]|eukprot:XP_012194341.1 hypothetical protein SPRG_00730 [Saprolegnia parasitica CBS 223.65]
MTTPGPTIPKFHIKREAPPVADELSDDEVASPPRQSKFDLPKDALKRESVPTNFYFVESSKNYEIERHLQLFKRKADPAKTEHGAKKSKKDISDKKTPATIDMADLVRSNDALKRSNDEVVRSNKAVIAANETACARVRPSARSCARPRPPSTAR